MELLTSFVAGLWLFVVGTQGLAHLVRYGLLPFLPSWIGRLDFTPQYTVLMGLVVITAAAGVLWREGKPGEVPDERQDAR